MRVIGGRFKGKKLLEPKDKETRPLKDLTKESIFNIINHSNKFSIDIKKANVLDLFSGVGSFGIECLSHGASYVTFVEKYEGVLPILKKNLNNLKSEINYEVVESDILNNFEFKSLKLGYDIVFLDPPYKEKALENKSSQALTANKKIGETALGAQYPQQDSLSEAIYKATGRVVPQSKPPENNNLTQERADELAKAFEKDSLLKQAATLVSNPVQGLAALGNQTSYNYVTDEFGTHSPGGDPALRSLTDLRKNKEWEDKGLRGTIDGNEFNTAGQIGMLAAGTLGAISKAPAAVKTSSKALKALNSLKNPLTTQTYLDAASGDFTSLGLKFLPKAIRGKLKKPLNSLYYGYKGSKIGG